MIEYISNFCNSIICTIMIIIILEMIMPDGKNKKYVMFVCGMVVTLTLIEPLINFMDINLEEVFASNQIEYNECKINENLYEDTLKESYEKVLIDDIINRLRENGYEVSNVRIEYDDVTFEPKKIYLNLEGETGYIQPVKIEVSKFAKKNKNEIIKNKLKDIISENYGVKKENIIIN